MSHDPLSAQAFADSFLTIDLPGLGWARAARAAPIELLTRRPDLMPARVVRVDRGRRVLIATGDGSLRGAHDRIGDEPVVVGDWVLAEPVGDDLVARGLVPRDGVLARRRDTDSSAPQVLAANVDTVLVAEALEPDRTINERRAARFVALATSGGADVVVLLTGADRLTGEGILPERIAGRRAIATSIVDGRGVAELRELLGPGTTAAIVGASGAGKSSLVNALLGEPLLAVGERRATGTGRHTTSVSRLVPLAHGALLVDTPGIRAVGMHHGADASELAPPLLAELAAACRFSDCAHDGEPGCAVAAAIERGELDPDAIDQWHRLEREALREQARSDAKVRSELRAHHRQQGKAVERARRRGEIVERRR
jgi:ribosome biogenesis GTPase